MAGFYFRLEAAPNGGTRQAWVTHRIRTRRGHPPTRPQLHTAVPNWQAGDTSRGRSGGC